MCCNLVHIFHPGFKPSFISSDASQIRLSSVIMARLMLENPLLHSEIWPIELNPRRNDSNWTETSFSEMERRGFLDFPQLTKETLIPAVYEISSGVNAVNQANSTLTYMRQIRMKGQNLSREKPRELCLSLKMIGI